MKCSTVLVILACLTTPVLAQDEAASPKPEPKAETITIAGKTYSIVPDEVLREMGFNIPDVAPEENAATLYIEAVNGYKPIERGSELKGLQKDVMRDRWTEQSGPLVEYLAKNEQTLALVQKAATKTQCHFPFLLEEGETLETSPVSDIHFPHLAGMRDLVRLVVVEGKAREYEGRSADALDAYLLAVQIGNHVAQDPTLIAGLVGVACDQIGMKAVEQGLVRHEPDEKALVRVQKRVHELAQHRPDFIATMRGERVLSTQMVEHMIKQPGWFSTKKGAALMRLDARNFWDEADKLFELPLPDFLKKAPFDELISKTDRKFPPNIMATLGPALSRVRITYARHDLEWTVLDVEFALARYKAKHGKYAKELDALKPFMLSDGIDPFSGEPLKYRIEDDGSFTIWSVGEDLVDNGGVIEPDKRRWECDDHVWNSGVIRGKD